MSYFLSVVFKQLFVETKGVCKTSYQACHNLYSKEAQAQGKGLFGRYALEPQEVDKSTFSNAYPIEAYRQYCKDCYQRKGRKVKEQRGTESK